MLSAPWGRGTEAEALLSTRFFRIDSLLSIIRRNRFSVLIRGLDSTRPGADHDGGGADSSLTTHDTATCFPASLPRLLVACSPLLHVRRLFASWRFWRVRAAPSAVMRWRCLPFWVGHRSILIESLLCPFTRWAILSPPVKSTKHNCAGRSINTMTLPYNWDEILSGEKAMWTRVFSNWSL